MGDVEESGRAFARYPRPKIRTWGTRFGGFLGWSSEMGRFWGWVGVFGWGTLLVG